MDMRGDSSGMFDLEGKRRSFQGVYNVTAVVHAAGGDECEKLGQETHRSITLMPLEI